MPKHTRRPRSIKEKTCFYVSTISWEGSSLGIHLPWMHECSFPLHISFFRWQPTKIHIRAAGLRLVGLGIGLGRSRPLSFARPEGKKDGRMGRWCVAERENGPQQIWKVALTHTTYASKLYALISAGDEPATLSSEHSTKEYPFCRRLGQLHRLLQDQTRKGESPFALKKLLSLSFRNIVRAI